MEFLNIVLVGGLAAASIPFIIYLLNRSRFKVEKWGAMHLLDSAMAVNRKRLKVEQLLLLLLRACIPGLLALCMARPVITHMQSLIRDSKSSVVILLDNSFSMEGGDSVETNFDLATQEASRVVDNLPRGSQTAIIGLAGPIASEEPSGYDLAESGKVLESAWGSYGVAQIPKALEEAAGLFSGSMHHADRQLLIISDFQKSSWDGDSMQRRNRAMELIENTSVRPRVILMNVGRKIDENVAVENVTLNQRVVAVDQPVQIRADLHNYGKETLNDLRVYFRVDGTGRSASQVSIGAGEDAQVLFSHRFKKAGSHILEIYIDADRLKADNACRLSVPVVDNLPVLIVDGDPSPEPLQSETAFLELALRPFKAANLELKDLISVTTVTEHEFKASMLQEAKVLILANISSLRDVELKAVEQFVDGGGGLIIFPGDKIDLDWYRTKLGRSGGLLPMRFGGMTGTTEGDAESTIVMEHYDHPALHLFNDPRNGDLSGARIRLGYKLVDSDNATDREARTIMAKLDNGTPFLVAKEYGHGQVIMSSIPVDGDWSNIPLRPFFLPLMQQLTTFAASKIHPARNIQIGEPIAAFLPIKDTDKHAILTGPNGEKHKLLVRKGGLHGIAEYTETRIPGVYLLEAPDGTITHYVVNTPPSESNIDCLTEGELATLANTMNASVVSSYQDYRDMERQRRFGQEIWVGLLWLVLIAVFGELFLIQYFARRKT